MNSIEFLYYRLDAGASTSKSKGIDEPFNKIAYSSFGKASICSTFSTKSGNSTTPSTGNENLDSLLKTISKDSNNAKMQESLNDVKSIRYER